MLEIEDRIIFHCGYCGKRMILKQGKGFFYYSCPGNINTDIKEYCSNNLSLKSAYIFLSNIKYNVDNNQLLDSTTCYRLNNYEFSIGEENNYSQTEVYVKQKKVIKIYE